jgi:hypothetical protein
VGVTTVAGTGHVSDIAPGTHRTRVLDAEETRELQAHARRFTVTTALDVVLLALLVAGFAAVVSLHASTPVRAPLALVVFGAAAFVFRRLLVAARLTRSVRADAEARTVLVFRPPLPPDEIDPGLSPVIELLGCSKLPWTHEGRPTRWRTASRRRFLLAG